MADDYNLSQSIVLESKVHTHYSKSHPFKFLKCEGKAYESTSGIGIAKEEHTTTSGRVNQRYYYHDSGQSYDGYFNADPNVFDVQNVSWNANFADEVLRFKLVKETNRGRNEWRNQECNDTNWDFKTVEAKANASIKLQVRVPDGAWLIGLRRLNGIDLTKVSIVNALQLIDSQLNDATGISQTEDRTYIYVQPNTIVEIELSFESSDFDTITNDTALEMTLFGRNKCYSRFNQYKDLSKIDIRSLENNKDSQFHFIEYLGCLASPPHLNEIMATKSMQQLDKTIMMLDQTRKTLISSGGTGPIINALDWTLFVVTNRATVEFEKLCEKRPVYDYRKREDLGTVRVYNLAGHLFDRARLVLQNFPMQRFERALTPGISEDMAREVASEFILDPQRHLSLVLKNVTSSLPDFKFGTSTRKDLLAAVEDVRMYYGHLNEEIVKLLLRKTNDPKLAHKNLYLLKQALVRAQTLLAQERTRLGTDSFSDGFFDQARIYTEEIYHPTVLKLFDQYKEFFLPMIAENLNVAPKDVRAEFARRVKEIEQCRSDY